MAEVKVERMVRAREIAGGQKKGRDPGVLGKALTASVSRPSAHTQLWELERQAALAAFGWTELQCASVCLWPRSNTLPYLEIIYY